MASSVPVHTISCRRPGVKLRPQKEQPSAGLGGRPPKSQERKSPHAPEEGAGGGTDTGTQANHLSPIPSPVHALQGPERGLYYEKEYSRT